MISLRELQQAFVGGVFDAGRSEVLDWIAPSAIDPGTRYAIYRNNAFHNFHEALRAVYPVIERLVGERFFAQAAQRYIRDHASPSGDLHRFGGEFADFLDAYAPAAQLPYLGDTARIEWRVHLAFHAADTTTLTLERFAVLAPEDYERLRLRLHPAIHLLASRFPVHRIWQVNQPDYAGDDRIDLDEAGALMMIRRSGYAVEVAAVSDAEYAMLESLQAGNVLPLALDAALRCDANFDFPGFLQTCVLNGTIADLDLQSGA